MKARFSLALVLAAALGACGYEAGDTSKGVLGSKADNKASASKADAGKAGASNSSAGGRSVEQQVASMAARLQSQVPIQMGGATLTGVQANGKELVTSVTFPMDLNQALADQIAQPLSAQQCGVPQMAEVMRRGGSMALKLTDSGGEEFTIRTTSC